MPRDDTMTDKRPLLRAMFDAAVAAAHPDRILGTHLPPPPEGRIICLAAGKAAGALAHAAERHYLGEGHIDPARLSGLATTRHGHGMPTSRIEIVEAGHPVPDVGAFDRLIAIVGLDAEHREAGRQRWREYERAGHAVSHVAKPAGGEG